MSHQIKIAHIKLKFTHIKLKFTHIKFFFNFFFYLINSPKLHSVDHKIDNIYNGI